jgi:hypothetical protein
MNKYFTEIRLFRLIDVGTFEDAVLKPLTVYDTMLLDELSGFYWIVLFETPCVKLFFSLYNKIELFAYIHQGREYTHSLR